MRATRRLDPDAVPLAVSLLSQLDLVPLSGRVVEQAAHLGGVALRSLDALHVASALALGSDLTEFIAYDRRLSAAASDLGLEVIQPGA